MHRVESGTRRGLLRTAFALALLAGAAPQAGAQDMLCCDVYIHKAGKWRGLEKQCRASVLKEMSAAKIKDVCEQMDEAGKECPEIDKLCPCDQDKIKRLEGRIRGLTEADQAHQQALKKATGERSNARDELWGKGEGLKFEGGSIAAFGESLVENLMAAGGGATAVGKAVQKTQDVIGWVETGKSIVDDPGSLDAWSDYGQKVIGKKADELLKQRTTEAFRAARENFQKTKNVYSANAEYTKKMGNYGGLKKFKEYGGKVTDFLGAVDGLRNLWNATDKLANDAQAWTDAFRDATGLEAEIEKLTADLLATEARLKRARAACSNKEKVSWLRLAAYEGGKPSSMQDAPVAGHLGSEPGNAEGIGVLLAQAGKANEAKAKAARNAKILAQAQRAQALLARVKERFAALDYRFGPAIVAPLSPWLAGTTSQAEPRQMLPLLAAEAAGGLNRFRTELNALTSYATQAKTALEAIPPDTMK